MSLDSFCELDFAGSFVMKMEISALTKKQLERYAQRRRNNKLGTANEGETTAILILCVLHNYFTPGGLHNLLPHLVLPPLLHSIASFTSRCGQPHPKCHWLLLPTNVAVEHDHGPVWMQRESVYPKANVLPLPFASNNIYSLGCLD
jgi:hypothetical protein